MPGAPLSDFLPSLSVLAGLCSVGFLSLVLVGGTLKVFPGLSRAVLGEDGARAGELDGLRGILSLLVILHHCTIVHTYCATGLYEAPQGNFANLAGEGAVALFFMITAYLYGRRLFAGAPLAWGALLAGRLRRLGPMYATAIVLLVAIVMAESHFTLRVTPLELAGQIIHWLSFDFLSLPDINGRTGTFYIEVVVWTLRYEWEFVLVLPLLALLVRGKGPWLLYAAALAALVTAPRPYQLWAYFAAGLAAAHLQARLAHLPWATPERWAGLGLAALALLLGCFHDIYGIPQMVLLTLVFLGATTGLGPWALLRARPLRFLGLISYSTYLLHHLVLHLVAHHMVGDLGFGALEGWSMQAAIIGIGAAAIGLATLTFLAIERPLLPAPATRRHR